MHKLPQIDHRHKVCVICEGDEDFEYFKRLINLSVWDKAYEFIPQNAHGESNIPSLYSNLYQNDRYEAVLIFCDTDKAPYREYSLLKKKLVEFHGGTTKTSVTERIIIFANPCTMQIILSHFGDVSLKNQGKKTNAALIEQLTGISNYDAHLNQIQELCGKIIRRNYADMKRRVELINNPDTVSASTNFIGFLNQFESDDVEWIHGIKQSLDDLKQ